MGGGGGGVLSLVSTCVQLSLGRMTNTECIQNKWMKESEQPCTVQRNTFVLGSSVFTLWRSLCRIGLKHTAG
jgi:hypothetical protein